MGEQVVNQYVDGDRDDFVIIPIEIDQRRAQVKDDAANLIRSQKLIPQLMIVAV